LIPFPEGQPLQNNRNLLLALVLSAAVIFGWSFLSQRLFPTPPPPVAGAKGSAGPGTQPYTPASPGLAPAPAALRDRAAVLAETPRVPIRTPRVEGSINLVGARIDDLVLKNYRETIKPGAQPIHLLSPAGTPGEYLASFGFAGAGAPGPDARWTVASGDVLAPGKPVTLATEAAGGARYELTFAIDDGYMVTATARVANRGAAPIAAQPYALITRTDPEKEPSEGHTGPVGAWDGKHFADSWKDIRSSDGQKKVLSGAPGWLGFSDQYWLTALIPDGQSDAAIRFSAPARFQADLTRPPVMVGPGMQATQTFRLFAGAKEVDLLDRYKSQLNIPLFDLANDWGWFKVIAKPLFELLSWLFRALGNYGLAIIALTFLVRLALFPIANKQYQSMNKMRVLAPKLKDIQERHKGDQEGLQKAMMEFYQKEKVNPVSGCLPILLQLPIFFALYKAFSISIEMRHAPFALWIRDLSAPDPVTPVNLFGLLPFTPPHAIAIGVLPILVGLTSFLQIKLNPPAPDPMQQKIFSFMPVVYTFIMAPFAAGLQLYWFTNNVLGIAQQWWLMRRHPAPPSGAGKPAAARAK